MKKQIPIILGNCVLIALFALSTNAGFAQSRTKAKTTTTTRVTPSTPKKSATPARTSTPSRSTTPTRSATPSRSSSSSRSSNSSSSYSSRSSSSGSSKSSSSGRSSSGSTSSSGSSYRSSSTPSRTYSSGSTSTESSSGTGSTRKTSTEPKKTSPATGQVKTHSSSPVQRTRTRITPVKTIKILDASNPEPEVKVINTKKTYPEYLGSSSAEAFKQMDRIVVNEGRIPSQTITANVITLATGTDMIPLTVDESGNPITVYEGVVALPKEQRDSISQICVAQINEAKEQGNTEEVQFWENVNRTMNQPDYDACIGKSYGDPHMRTYDGYTYDLQSVGEFILTKSTTSSFEIQTRQSPAPGSISLNTATAMNVNGDRVCIYTRGFPDNYTGIPIRVNGNPLRMKPGEVYALRNGGIVKRMGSNYRVSWPTGEQAYVKFFTSRQKKYINVLPQVFEAGNHGSYVGLLGNADGIPGNDLQSKHGRQTGVVGYFYSMNELTGNTRIPRSTKREEIKHNRSLINDFGDSWRLGQNSLFDYAVNVSTSSFRLYSYEEKNPPTLASLRKKDVLSAKKACEEAGIKDEDVLRGCILDVATSKDTSIAKAIADIEDDEALAKEMKVLNPIRSK